MILIEFGLGSILIIVAIIFGWRLFDLFKQDGLWINEAKNPEVDIERIYPAFPIKDVNVSNKQEVK